MFHGMPGEVGELLPLERATHTLPVAVSPNSVRRWITRGVGGRKLTAVRVGNRFFVDPARLGEFITQLNAAEPPA